MSPLVRCADAVALAREAARRIAESAREAIAARGRFDLVVPGGRSAAALFDALAGPHVAQLFWPRVQLWFADERAVAPGAPESNFHLALERLVEPVGLPAANVHRMTGEAHDLAAAAAEYDAQFPARVDVLVLGVGEDAHVASLFPGSPLLAHPGTARVAAVFDAPKPPPGRITLTPPAFAAARRTLVLASGAGKADAVASALAPGADPSRAPAALVARAEWLVDADAAARAVAG